uniref:Legume lectin domain-containing protein n=1 Tax=Oryza barthii TaxID=65489 RepID=A0A0D3FZB5_9ORYZ
MSSTTCLISRGAFLLLAAAVAVALPCAAALQELQLQDAVLIDDVVQEAAQAWYHGRHRRTGVTYPLSLPGSLSGVAADVARFRSGGTESAVRGQASHLLAVRANLGNLSSVFDEYAASGGYRIASPVLGLTFYGLARRGGTARLEVLVTAAAIRVNFSMAVPALQPGAVPLCVTDVQAGSNTCHVWDQGHFALVLGGAGDGGGVVAEAGEVSKWKLALFGAALGAGGTVLLGLVLVAVLSIQRRKSEVVEMARRAYEEEALRVSMVGHVRAPSAGGSRTTPDALENEYCAAL